MPHWKVWWMAGYQGNSQRNIGWKFESTSKKNHFAVNSRFLGRATHRDYQRLSQAARWTFPWMGQKTTWFTASRKDSLVAVHDQCFNRSWKFWVNQTQILLSVPVLMLRKHIQHYSFWTRIMKRTVILKLSELYLLYSLHDLHFMICSSINMKIVKLRTISKMTFRRALKHFFFLKFKWSRNKLETTWILNKYHPRINATLK